MNISRKLLFALLAAIVSPALFAQTTSTIEGAITDAQGRAVAGAQVTASGSTLSTRRSVASDSSGMYRLPALPPGKYTVEVSQSGFAGKRASVELALNQTAVVNLRLETAAVQETMEVIAQPGGVVIDPTSAAVATTVTPRQIEQLPVSGRNYLDLLQLVPGVTINRHVDPKGDEATPMLGERGGNTNYLIDGHSNKNTYQGGAAAQFNQDTIAEFQVLTTGYKAEFGSATGGIVNVVTKSGNNDWRGTLSAFGRNDALDASNSLDRTQRNPPQLRRGDYSLTLGGPVIRDRVFFFGSGERIDETRRLDFTFPPATPQIVRNFEKGFDKPSEQDEWRGFFKLDETLGVHQLTQEINYTDSKQNDFLPLSFSNSLPSSRNNLRNKTRLIGLSDTVLLGNTATPWLFIARAADRAESAVNVPAHPEAGPATRFNIFDTLTSGQTFGNLGAVDFGNSSTGSDIQQRYLSFDGSAEKLLLRHDVKFGINFLRTRVTGPVAGLAISQLFATIEDFATYGPVNSGFFTLTQLAGPTPKDQELHIRNEHNGLFLQDDWKLLPTLTANVGARWDYDSEFGNKRNLSPRLGLVWSPTPATIVRGHAGRFYDQFRLGLAERIPAFGGADLRISQPFSYPRGFYGIPTNAPVLVGLCLSPTLTDAQIAAAGSKCPFGPLPFIGVDRINRVVAPGHAPIPANSVINISNVQQLSGLTPDEFTRQASIALGLPPSFFYWGPFGTLTHPVIPAQQLPVTVAPNFRTPHTDSYGLGFEHQFSSNLVVAVDLNYRRMRDILGERISNLAFESRLPGKARTFTSGGIGITSMGPWFEGTYKGATLSFNQRVGNRLTVGGTYTHAKAIDNNAFGVFGVPSDNFQGIVPEVTEKATGKTNTSGSFVAANGHFIPKAGTYYNGANLDKGPSDLSVDDFGQLNAVLELPWQFQLSGIFRAQSGFHFTRRALVSDDPDGDLAFYDSDLPSGRNHFTGPAFSSLDVRLAKSFGVARGARAQVLIEFFNALNRKNPAAVERAVGTPTRFGTATQVLPGREGQIGIRVEF